MKAVLEFTLPEEATAHKWALNGGLYQSVIVDVLNAIRSKLKYQDVSKATRETLEELRSLIFELVPDIQDD